MIKKTAFIFPGQGSQYVGMGKDLYSSCKVAKKIFDRADKILGKNISELCFNGTAEELKQTINTQPAIVTTSIALLEAFKAKLNIEPYCVAGHSLGEYCAMYSAGVLNLDTTLKFIKKRAELMDEVKTGGMVAVLNAEPEILEQGLLEGSKHGYVDVANYNSEKQVVITGAKEALEITCEFINKNTTAKTIPLSVSGAFHSKYLEEKADKFADFIKDFEVNDAKFPVVTNVDAKSTVKKEDFIKKMPEQMHSSVYWLQTIKNMIADGVEIFIEIGPGKVLSNLNKRINSQIKTYNVSDNPTLEQTVADLKQELCCSIK